MKSNTHVKNRGKQTNSFSYAINRLRINRKCLCSSNSTDSDVTWRDDAAQHAAMHHGVNWTSLSTKGKSSGISLRERSAPRSPFLVQQQYVYVVAVVKEALIEKLRGEMGLVPSWTKNMLQTAQAINCRKRENESERFVRKNAECSRCLFENATLTLA
jgi:hypothetical protein